MGYRERRRGPKNEQWGTPAVTRCGLDTSVPLDRGGSERPLCQRQWKGLAGSGEMAEMLLLLSGHLQKSGGNLS